MNFRLPYPNVFSSVPDFIVALTFLVTWIEPSTLGEGMIVSLFQVMLLEFIIIHSAGFMGHVIYGTAPRSKKILHLSGLGLFYFVFVAGFALGFRSWWPVIAFGGLLLNRMLSVLTGQFEQGKERESAMQQWGINVACYLVSLFAVILLPVPEWGVPSDALAHLDMSGDFVEQPHTMIAWGTVYYFMVGWFEWKGPSASAVRS